MQILGVVMDFEKFDLLTLDYYPEITGLLVTFQ